jgi:hypothetical protein
MEYQQALVIGKRRRSDAVYLLTMHMRERVMEVCALQPATDSGLDSRQWEPVGAECFKELCVRNDLMGNREAYLLVVDAKGTAKACTQRTYPLPIALQWVMAIPLPVYAGPGGVLMAQRIEEGLRKAKAMAQTP